MAPPKRGAVAGCSPGGPGGDLGGRALAARPSFPLLAEIGLFRIVLFLGPPVVSRLFYAELPCTNFLASVRLYNNILMDPGGFLSEGTCGSGGPSFCISALRRTGSVVPWCCSLLDEYEEKNGGKKKWCLCISYSTAVFAESFVASVFKYEKLGKQYCDSRIKCLHLLGIVYVLLVHVILLFFCTNVCVSGTMYAHFCSLLAVTVFSISGKSRCSYDNAFTEVFVGKYSVYVELRTCCEASYDFGLVVCMWI